MECLIFLAFGAPIGMLGAGWPEARQLFGQSSGALGIAAVIYFLLGMNMSDFQEEAKEEQRKAAKAKAAAEKASGEKIKIARPQR